jgi:hypothetical protein
MKVRRLTNPALKPILGCSHSPNESQRCSPDPELFSQPDKSKRAKKMLELTLSQVFSDLDESKKAEKPNLTYHRLFSRPG